MESVKGNTLPFKDTMELSKIKGSRVLTKDGKNIGKVKSVHIHPKNLTIEGIVIDPGYFDAYQFMGADYIASITNSGVVLKIHPVTEYVGIKVFDFKGKKIGKVKKVNRSNKSNNLMSIIVDRDGKEDVLIRADYIAAAGKNIVLKEPFPL